jgi:tetratricopeptide (TPR) repeat protein
MELPGGFRIPIIVGTWAFLAVANLPAQQPSGGTRTGGSGGTTTTPTTGGGGGTSGSRSGGGNTGNPSGATPQSLPSMPQPVFVSGRVLLEDGTPATGQVVIERICQTRTFREGYADSRGYFSIQLGINTGVFNDASTNTMELGTGGLGGFNGGGPNSASSSESQYASCEIRASLAGFRSDSLPLFNIRPLNRNDVGVIVLHNYANVQGLTTSATSALAPKDARKSFERGKKALESNKPDEAQKELLNAVGLFPRFAEAWYDLGRVYERRDHKEEARDAYGKAIAADANFVPPYERLYLMAFGENKWQEVVETSDRVLRLNPYDFPGAYYVNAVANFQLKNFDAAEKSARQATRLVGKQAEPRSHYVLGLALAQKGDFSASSQSLNTYMKVAPPGTNLDQVQKILSDVDRLAARNPALPPAASTPAKEAQ